MKDRGILYIKPGCPWCREAENFFSQHGIDIEVRDVTSNHGAMNRMVSISGQTLTPTFEFGEFVVADFSINEFLEELEQFPEVRLELGIGDDED